MDNEKNTENQYHWLEAMALGYFRNFIKNSDESEPSSPFFQPATWIMNSQQWKILLVGTIPENIWKAAEQVIAEKDPRNDMWDYEKTQIILAFIWKRDDVREKLRAMLLQKADEELAKNPTETNAREIVPQQFAILKKAIKLNEMESNALLALWCWERYGLESEFDSNEKDRKLAFLTQCLDCLQEEARALVAEKGKLRRWNCISDSWSVCEHTIDFLKGHYEDPMKYDSFKENSDEALPWSVYGEDLQSQGALLERLISNCDGTDGIQILLYGRAGTGKRSFAKTLAERLHRTCYFINQSPGDGKGYFAGMPFRLDALHTCENAVDSATSLIVVDGADDLLYSGAAYDTVHRIMPECVSVYAKGTINRFMDIAKVPVIWIVDNHSALDCIDKSTGYRFDYSVLFPMQNFPDRIKVWRYQVEKWKLQDLIGEELQKKFVEKYKVTAGCIAKTVRSIAKLKPKAEEVELFVDKLIMTHCVQLVTTPY